MPYALDKSGLCCYELCDQLKIDPELYKKLIQLAPTSTPADRNAVQEEVQPATEEQQPVEGENLEEPHQEPQELTTEVQRFSISC